MKAHRTIMRVLDKVQNPSNLERILTDNIHKMAMLSLVDTEVNQIDEIAKDAGDLRRGEMAMRIDGALQVLQMNYLDHSNGSLFSTTLPINALTEDNIVEVEITGQLLNNTGGTLNLLPRVYLGPESAEVIVTSENTISVATGTTYKTWTYKVRIKQAPWLGNWVQVDDELTIGSSNPIVNSTTTELDGDIGDEMSLLFRVGFSSGTAYLNIRMIYNTWTVYLIDGVSNDQKRFWTQPTGSRSFDTYINSAATTTNYGNNGQIQGGENDSSVSSRAILIRFDDILNIPTNAKIDQVILWLMVNIDQSSNARTWEAFRVLRNWVAGNGSAGSGATWNTFDGTNNWGTAGCLNSTTDYDPTVAATCSFTASEVQGTIKGFLFDVDEFQKFVTREYSYYGHVIRPQVMNNDGYVFYSGDNATPTLAPILEVLWHYPD